MCTKTNVLNGNKPKRIHKFYICNTATNIYYKINDNTIEILKIISDNKTDDIVKLIQCIKKIEEIPDAQKILIENGISIIQKESNKV